MTVTNVGTVVVPVRDQDAALRFYTEALGFEVRLDAEFAPGQRWLEVAPAGAQTTVAIVPAQAATVSLVTDDARADHAAMTAAGVDVDDLLDMGGGVPPMFTFRDPDGNPFRVVERPA